MLAHQKSSERNIPVLVFLQTDFRHGRVNLQDIQLIYILLSEEYECISDFNYNKNYDEIITNDKVIE